MSKTSRRAGHLSRRRFRIAVVGVSVVGAAAGSVLLATRAGSTPTSSVSATLRIPGNPEALAAGPDAVWAALTRDSPEPTGDPRLVRLDLATNDSAHPVYLGGEATHLARLGNRLIVSVRHPSGIGQLAVLDWRNGAELFRHWYDGPVVETLVQGDELWVLEERPARLQQLDPRTLDPAAAAIRLGASSIAAATTGYGHLWATAPDDGDVLRITPKTRTVERVHVGGSPAGIVVANGSVWFADRSHSVIRRLDPVTLRPVGDPTHVGPSPDKLVEAGTSLFVTDGADGSIARIDVSSARQIGQPVRLFGRSGKDNTLAAAAGESVWFANLASSTLSRIDRSSGDANGDGKVTIRISGTKAATANADRVTNGGAAATSHFVASGALTGTWTAVLYRTLKPPLITLRYVTKDSKGSITFVIKANVNSAPWDDHPWSITSATKGYRGLHGQGVERENADYTVSTLTGTVSR